MTVWVISSPSAGTAPRSMGSVSVKVAVGKVAVSMIRPWNCPSRRDSGLVTVVMSTVTSVAVTVVPLISSVPVTSGVRPTASASWPNSTSLHSVARLAPRADGPGPLDPVRSGARVACRRRRRLACAVTGGGGVASSRVSRSGASSRMRLM